MPTFQRTLSLGIVTATLVVVAACSSSPSSDGEGSGTEEAARNGEPLVIGTSGTYRPLAFSDAGDLVGLEVDLGNAFGDALDRPVEWVEAPFSGLLPGLENGQYDLVMSGMTMTDERQNQFTFTEPYFYDGIVAVVQADDETVADVRDMDGLRVGGIGGSTNEEAANEIGGYSEFVDYPGVPEGMSDLIAGRIDMYLTPRINAAEFINSAPNGDEVKIVGEDYNPMPFGAAISADAEELKPEIDAVIDQLINDGTFEEWSMSWLGYPLETRVDD